MKLALIVTGVLFIVIALIKGGLHIYLNYKNGYKVDLRASGAGIKYLLPYNEDVAPEYESLKRLCNIMQKISMGLILIILVLALLNAR